MSNKLKYLIFFLLVSCSPKLNKVIKQRGLLIVTPQKLKLAKVIVIPWRRDKSKLSAITKGIQVDLTLPTFEREEARKLFENGKVDSWLLTILKRSRGGLETIGQIYIPIHPGTNKRKRINSFPKIDKVAVKIYYSAAAPSKRFESFLCPAFGHNKKIVGIKKIISRKRDKMWKVFKERRILSDPKRIELAPRVFNGGSSFKGQIQFDLALFNSKTKFLSSNFVSFDELIKIDKEVSIDLAGCDNFEIPKKIKKLKRGFRLKK